MNVLVTSTRMPFALEEIRKLGRSGHCVYGADTFRSAPGNHSKHVARSFITASPTFDTPRFLDELEEILSERRVDRLMPAFEEVFYVARHRARFEALTELFFPPFEVLRRLHDKASFVRLAAELGLTVPRTIVARDRAELAAAARQLGRYFARPAYSRGGVILYTNEGPLAGSVTLEDCEPSASNPFLVQTFVEGTDVCTFSIAHHGRIACHSTYVHPLTVEHAGGIVFESVVDDEVLEATRRIVEATAYHGRISFDFIRTKDALVAIECNPRPTAGVTIMSDEMYDDGLMDRRPDRTLVAPAGTRRKLSLGILRNMAVELSGFPEDVEALLSGGKDLHADPHDLRPLLWQLIAYGRILGYRARKGRVKRSDLIQGYFYDILWNGDGESAERTPASSSWRSTVR